ncbi:glycoside hydrolase family 24 protein [Limnofasciculus baicalensis]
MANGYSPFQKTYSPLPIPSCLMNRIIKWINILIIITVALEIRAGYRPDGWNFNNPKGISGTQPLVMRGGDPYIRALMRTISASEANVSQPYSVLYGGQHVWDLSRHPNRCVRIVNGPNVGKCTTAAGRYQFINTTWADKARRYHPRPWGFLTWKDYSFEPQYQDAVVYSWLADKQYWGIDISGQLQKGNVSRVLQRLSGTWTSLGYGIETNSMSNSLPGIYQKMLKEELGKAG